MREIELGVGVKVADSRYTNLATASDDGHGFDVAGRKALKGRIVGILL
jgi:hypothetical protein